MWHDKDQGAVDETKFEFQPVPVLRQAAKIVDTAEREMLAEWLAAERRVKWQRRRQRVGEGAFASLIALGTIVDPRPSFLIQWPHLPGEPSV